MNATDDILSLIGNTPLLRLKKVSKRFNVNIFVKCEHFNPSGSIKDRMALRMVNKAIAEGKLKSDGVIVEQSSGNTGPALAFIGGVKGYKVRIFIPAKWTGTYSPTERIKIMKLFGGEVKTLDFDTYGKVFEGISDEDKAIAVIAIGMRKCHDLERKNPKLWWPNQMCNINNALAHRDTTGREIIEQLRGKLDAWVASIGTGGTLLGVAEAVQKENPGVAIVGVQPTDASITEWVRSGKIDRFLNALKVPKGTLLVETMLERGLPDEIITVTDVDAREMANRLCLEEGLFCGMSSGANVCAAIQVAKRLGRNSNVVTVLVDRRDRYLSENPNEHYVV